MKGRLLDVQTTDFASARVDTLRAIGTSGEQDFSGGEIRDQLGLRSTWFSFGVLSLDPQPKTTLAYGTPFTLTGIARDIGDVELEQRTLANAAWVPNRGVEPGDDGSYSVTVKAAAPAEYRVSTESTVTPATSVAVAPLLTLKASPDLTRLKGVLKPVLPKISVQIQQVVHGRWTTMTKIQPTRLGRFTFDPSAPGGVYRARVVPGGGWAAALTPKVALQ